eukprot:6314285-Prymnesium_polylepis.1
MLGKGHRASREGCSRIHADNGKIKPDCRFIQCVTFPGIILLASTTRHHTTHIRRKSVDGASRCVFAQPRAPRAGSQSDTQRPKSEDAQSL